MMRAPAALFVLLAASLSGCASQGEDHVASARELLGAADEKARAWDPDAKLVLVNAAEFNARVGAAAPAGMRYDTRVGDGLAPSWSFMYEGNSSDGKNVYAVSVDASGDVVQAGAHGPADVSLFSPLGEWPVDSDEAVKEALGQREFLDALAAEPVLLQATLLRIRGERPAWLLATLGGGGAVQVGVDALDGSAVNATAYALRLLPDPEGGRIAGRVTVLEPTVHAFTVQKAMHPTLKIGFAPNPPTLIGTLNVTLAGPTKRYSFDFDFNPRGPSPKALPVMRPEPGRWTATVRLTLGVAMDYQFAWCAEGREVAAKPQGC